MKQLIKDVLETQAANQVNLSSDAAREQIANAILAKIKNNNTGWTLDLSTLDGKAKLTPEEIEEQNYKEFWTCAICGEDTSKVDYDYIGSGTNHLGCELKTEQEIEEFVEDIDEQAYAQGRKSSYDGDSLQQKEDFEKRSTKDRRKGDRREKNWAQKKHEEKVFGIEAEASARRTSKSFEKGDASSIATKAYVEMTADGLPPGGDAQAVLESHKLAEEIVDNQEGKWIYESPDGGKTDFRRPIGDYDMKNKEEINWETKQPTGRMFTQFPFPSDEIVKEV